MSPLRKVRTLLTREEKRRLALISGAFCVMALLLVLGVGSVGPFIAAADARRELCPEKGEVSPSPQPWRRSRFPLPSRRKETPLDIVIYEKGSLSAGSPWQL